MLHMLQDFLALFQRFPITPGSSTKHECDMEPKLFLLAAREKGTELMPIAA